MLDGRVLEASQVEYEPFGKPPLQNSPRIPCYTLNFFNTSANTIAICIHISAAPSRYTRLISTCRSTCRMNMFFPDTPARRVIRLGAAPPCRACPALKPRQAAEPPLSPGSMLYVLYVLYLTRQAAEPPLSPGSLLYVLYVLYLTRQAAEPPLSPGSLLYVLQVLYVLYALQNVVYVLYKAYLVHVEMLCV